MPSQLHEVLLQFFRNRPELAPALLEQALGVTLPRYTEARIESAELSDVLPAEYRADLVVLLVDGVPVLGIVIEVQLKADDRKRYSWPMYVAGLRARFRCPCCLLVVTSDDRTAHWASEPIELGPGASLNPLVLGPEGVPVVTDLQQAERFPELAVMSVMAHGQGDVQTAIKLATLAAEASRRLDDDTQALYWDLIEAALGDAARKAFEMLPQTYQFTGPSYLKGRAEGKAEGKANDILTILQTRGLELSDAQRERILGCTDLELLNLWVRRAVTLTDISELFAQ